MEKRVLSAPQVVGRTLGGDLLLHKTLLGYSGKMYSHLEHLEVIYDLGQLHHYQIMLFLLRGQGYYFVSVFPF